MTRGSRDESVPLLGRDELERRLRTAEQGGGRWLAGDDGASLRPGRGEPLPAAVLVGIVDRRPEPTVLLTQRTDHLRDHGGQISFPGGRVEPGDPTLVATALREAEEEIGLDPARVEMLGELVPYETITGFRIHPMVGWITPPFEVRLDPFEVADAFEVPLRFVIDPRNHRRQTYRRGPHTRSYFVLPYQKRFIWGATAGILVNLAGLLRS
ncbi:MAG: CoA pyrophosphatase [Geminicoccaceae bacterium]|nr:CoA pyrophosphatase [Geminicoccaceae bacterium]